MIQRTGSTSNVLEMANSPSSRIMPIYASNGRPILPIHTAKKPRWYSMVYSQLRRNCRGSKLARNLFVMIIFTAIGVFWSMPLTELDPESTMLNLGLKLNSFSASTPQRYIIVIDAGSSGSRLLVYSWTPVSTHSRSLIALEQGNGKEFQMTQEPGLSWFVNNTLAVKDHLGPLLDFASSIIPSTDHENTPLFVFATAGMRLVPESSQTSLMSSSCSFVQSSYPFDTSGGCDTHFRIISGNFEGILGWLSVNYLKKSLDSSDTFGFMDMGGASAQIAFEPTLSMATAHANDLQKLKLRYMNGLEAEYSLFVSSFLGFGANQALSRYKQSFKSSYSDDPCLPSGLNHTFDQTTLIGTGSFQKCVANLSPLLNKELPCPEDPCLFNGVHAPIEDFVNHRFVGISEFWYSLHNVFDKGGVYDYASIHVAAETFCSLSWDAITDLFSKNEIPFVESLERLETQCFKSAWILSVLYDGFGLDKVSRKADQPMFESLHEVDGFTLSWTLGVALLVASSSIQPASGILWIVIFSLIALVFIGIAFSRNFRNRQVYSTVLNSPQLEESIGIHVSSH